MWRALFGRGRDASQPAPRADAVPDAEAARRALLAYHRRTAHGFARFAAGPQDLDWATQPAPFRTWAGAERTPLARFACDPAEAGREPGPRGTPSPAYAATLAGAVAPPAALDAAGVARWLFDAFSLSAQKSYGDSRWFLRVPPSSGNLHPGEVHLVLPDVPGLAPGAAVWHYDPREHALERRAALDRELEAALFDRRPAGLFYVGLSAIAWREAWKYGERAFRYVQHDAGHLLACLDLAAALSGWQARLADELGHGALERLLGLAREDGPEAERPTALVAVLPAGAERGVPLDDAEVGRAPAPRFVGLPTPLSPDHVEWDAIEIAEVASRAGPGGVRAAAAVRGAEHAAIRAPNPAADADLPRLRELVRRRRSAVAFERGATLAKDAWLAGLARLLPAPGARPFSLWPHTPRVHPVCFVHSVAGVAPGLYLLARGAGALARLAPSFGNAGALGPARLERVDGVPDDLPLVRLASGDVRGLAAELACGQALAGDAVFAVAFVAELEAALAELGPPAYRRLHWEAGLLGHVLYLEAEAQGLAGTGIGCFFDGETQRALGLVGERVVTLYHFAVGRAVHDPRIVAAPPYA